MNRRSVLSSLLLLPFARSAFGFTKSDVVQQFHAKYSGLTSVACTFSSAQVKGTLLAKTSGRYRIELDDRLIVCDGKKICNVQRSTKTVVIDSYKANSEEISIERIFFVLLNVYRATDISSAKTIQIKLTPPDKTAMVAGVTESVVYLGDNMSISRIDVAEGSARTTWSISKLRLNSNIANSEFAYSPPKGWTVVDLR